MTPNHILTLLLCLCLVSPVAAVTYSEEYHNLSSKSDSMVERGYEIVPQGIMSTSFYTLANFYELRRQTILMEKQNELLEEQNWYLMQLVRQKDNTTIVVYNRSAGNTWIYPKGVV